MAFAFSRMPCFGEWLESQSIDAQQSIQRTATAAPVFNRFGEF